MRTIDDFYSEVPPGTLYHYTGIGGLLGIVASRRVWASNAYYMNDSREIIHACDILKRLLAKAEREADGEEREFVSQCGAWLEHFRVTAFHLFVFSLSAAPNLLSQWRSYTPHGKGVSIGFAPSVLIHILKSSGFRLAKCLYEANEHEDLMGRLLDKLLITFRQRRASLDITRHHPTQKYHGFLEEFRGDVLQVLAIVKHDAFREECEWRVVSPYFPNYTVPEVEFREGGSMLLPYIALKLPDPSAGVLFDSVTLGPSEDVSLSFSALSAFLSNKKVCNTTINSQMPLRSWK